MLTAWEKRESFVLIFVSLKEGFSDSSVGKESTCNAGDFS